jgi:hypothetical protein
MLTWGTNKDCTGTAKDYMVKLIMTTWGTNKDLHDNY